MAQSAEEYYLNTVRKKFKKYVPTWLPNTKFEIGMIGVLTDDSFDPIKPLVNAGIDFDPATQIAPDTSPSPFRYTSESGVTFTSKLAGEVRTDFPTIPQAEAAISYTFDTKGAFVLEAEKAYEPRILDKDWLLSEVIKAYKDGRWKSNWVVVTQVLHCPRLDILISKSTNSEVLITASGNANIGTGIELGKANIELKAQIRRGEVYNGVGSEDVTPLVRVAKLKVGPFGHINTDGFKIANALKDAMNDITPQLVKSDKKVEKNLVLDEVWA